MKAVQLKNGFGFEELALTELDIPVPGRLEVLIRIRAASLNYRDLVILNGVMPIGIQFPFIPLSDGAGEIVAVGGRGDKISGWTKGSGKFPTEIHWREHQSGGIKGQSGRPAQWSGG
ncbi:alcohol dehydrogenase catalytic domain-containing protein [Paenibacillus sp. RC343]|uniref:alcohol dehydrogenase catalytic domain-containing protein n=1 Tax=Paenibacillus sp. RC343 TaxID=3045841 RepID=UPI0024BAB9D0|nr:alcohol dehydrogenase catalytic domain-containing protein [Paenibacillus sp. RC343]